MVIWLCLGIYWLSDTTKEPTHGILSSAGEMMKGATDTVDHVANTATQTAGLGNVADSVTNAPVALTQSLGSQGLCNKHLYNMSLVIIILSFLWCPCLLMAMVCMLWNTVLVLSKGRKNKSRDALSSDSDY